MAGSRRRWRVADCCRHIPPGLHLPRAILGDAHRPARTVCARSVTREAHACFWRRAVAALPRQRAVRPALLLGRRPGRRALLGALRVLARGRRQLRRRRPVARGDARGHAAAPMQLAQPGVRRRHEHRVLRAPGRARVLARVASAPLAHHRARGAAAPLPTGGAPLVRTRCAPVRAHHLWRLAHVWRRRGPPAAPAALRGG
mmetsp:Transcript_23288/g.59298  ORF Transcript_23288/g.59298 Transcript_23288/m.59298 type:complete len:201 (-) Transcript_23288:259-861(-)